MDLSEYPRLERVLSILLKRIPPAGVNSVDIKKLTLCYLRLFSILAIKKIKSEQKLPDLMEKDTPVQQIKRNDLAIVTEKIKEMYMMLIVLEARMQNMVPATESLRIVRERVNVNL